MVDEEDSVEVTEEDGVEGEVASVTEEDEEEDGEGSVVIEEVEVRSTQLSCLVASENNL